MGTNNDDVKSAETVAKVNKHFIKQFAPLFTIGHGASGGSMQQHRSPTPIPACSTVSCPAQLCRRDDLPAAALRLRAVADRLHNRPAPMAEGRSGRQVLGLLRQPRHALSERPAGAAMRRSRMRRRTTLSQQGRALHLQDNLVNIFERTQDRVCPQPVRQCRRAIWLAGAQRWQDHLRPVCRGECQCQR